MNIKFFFNFYCIFQLKNFLIFFLINYLVTQVQISIGCHWRNVGLKSAQLRPQSDQWWGKPLLQKFNFLIFDCRHNSGPQLNRCSGKLAATVKKFTFWWLSRKFTIYKIISLSTLPCKRIIVIRVWDCSSALGCALNLSKS